MSATTFRIVTQGLLPGHAPEAAAERLAALFKSGAAQVAPMVAAHPVIVKLGLDHETAEKYAQALARCGCRCTIEAESADAPAPPVPPILHGGAVPRVPADDMGVLTLSNDRLRQLQPSLFEDPRCSAAHRDTWLATIGATLARADGRAAVVVDAANGIVASYLHELDCVVLLAFDPALSLAHGWQNGTRLLSANSYVRRAKGIAADLQPGRHDTGRFGNVWPMIADLLTDDHVHLNTRKRAIGDDEWERTWRLGRGLLAMQCPARDGRPLRSNRAARIDATTAPAAAHAPTVFSRDGAARRKHRWLQGTLGECAKDAGMFGVCAWIGWGAATRVTAISHNGLFYLACFGITLLAIAGLACLRNAASALRGA